MTVVIGHSQAKYLSEYLPGQDYCVFSYPGYRVSQFYQEQDIMEVIPYFSTIVLIVGANDISCTNPSNIASDIRSLCEDIHAQNESATIIMSEILPRAQNLFHGRQLSHNRLEQWNIDACIVNGFLRDLASECPWLKTMQHPDFHTLFGAKRSFLSNDGLHLSYEGTENLCSSIEQAVNITVPVSTTTAQPVEVKTISSNHNDYPTVFGPRLYREVVTSDRKRTVNPQSTVSSRVGARTPTSDRTRTVNPQSTVSSRVGARTPTNTRTRTVNPQSTVSSRVGARTPTNTRTRTVNPQSTVSSRVGARTPTNTRTRTVNPQSKVSSSVGARTPTNVRKRTVKQKRKTVNSQMIDINAIVMWINGYSDKPHFLNQQCGGGQTDEIPSKSVDPSLIAHGTHAETVHNNEPEPSLLPVKSASSPSLPEDTNVANTRMMYSNNIYRDSVNNPITFEYARGILLMCDKGEIHENLITKTRPLKPKAGQIIIVDTQSLSHKLERRCDDYQWVNDGSKKLPNKSPTVCKTRHKIRCAKEGKGRAKGSTDFIRMEFYLLNNDRYVLFHYTGDETVYKNVLHGNISSDEITKPYTRTCPSVIETIKEELEKDKNPSTIYNNLKYRVQGPQASAGAPRDLKQVQNLSANRQRNKRLSQDKIYNSLELAFQLDGFVIQIDLYPSLTVILGLKQTLSDFNNLLSIKRDERLFLSIDTTFDCGNFYVTPIVYKNFLFESEPTIPLAFMLHEKKDQKFQERFLTLLSEKCPNMQQTKINFVADREVALTKAVEKILPNASVFHCWNHVKRDVREWLRQRKTPTSNVDLYTTNLDTLLRQKTEDAFNEKYEELNGPWCEAFSQYFEKHIKSDIFSYSGRWLLEEAQIFSETSGVTTNISESFNSLLKFTNDHKKLPVDNMILSLFYLQNSIHCEVLRGRARLGNYNLKKEFLHHAIELSELIFPNEIIHPDDIVSTAKSVCENVNMRNKENDCEQNEEDSGKKFETQQDLAEKVIKNDGVKLVGGNHRAFMVRGVGGQNYSVTLYPNEKCHCPSLGTCYHILAAKKSIGINISDEKIERKLISLMRYKNRPKTQKRLGQKKPKPSDYESVVPAPDSKLARMEEELSGNFANKTPTEEIDEEIIDNNECSGILSPIAKTISTKSKSPTTIDRHESRKRSASPEKAAHKKCKLEMPPIKSPVKYEVISDFETNRHSDVIDSMPWISTLDLDTNDKQILLDEQWLTDKHLNAVIQLLNKQYPKIHGLQDTKLSPFFMEYQKVWNVNRKFLRQIDSPCIQLHFDGSCHWTISMISPDDPKCVYYLDSLGDNLKLLKNNIQIQLSQLYQGERGCLQVKTPRIQQQPNSNDCGLFAIAQAVDFCHSGGKLNFKHHYIVPEMREHLFHCFENNKMSPFPKDSNKLQRSSSFQGIHKTFKIKTTCVCEMPEFVDNMIQCENKKCKKWFHQTCVGVKSQRKRSVDKPWPWQCFFCSHVN